MDFSILEKAVLYNALKQYLPYLESCLENPENNNQLVFIAADSEITKDLMDKIKRDYLEEGGDVSRL